MALSDAVKAAETEKVNAKPAGGAPEAKAGKGSSGLQAFKADGAAVRAQLSEDEKSIECSKSDKVEFVAAIGDPSKDTSRVEKGQSIASHPVVGFQFKLLEDAEVPFSPIKVNGKGILDVEPVQMRQHKAGEIISLNLSETARFMSQLQYGGRFTGGANPVILTATVTQDRANEPLPVLKYASGTGSIKEGMVLVADMVGADPSKKYKGEPQLKDEFKESFAGLYSRKRLTRTKTEKKAGEDCKNIAAAFRKYYAERA